MGVFVVDSLDYHRASKDKRREIGALLALVWPESEEPSQEVPQTHPADLAAQSFCCTCEGKLVAYGAVLSTEILHGGLSFSMGGLSCVATHPAYRGQGAGQALVRAATRWMEESGRFDLGIFTCHPGLVPFYRSAGGWEEKPEVELVGSLEEGALSSRFLDVAVLMRLFSPKAISWEMNFPKEPVNLNFPVGQFL